jgi:signal transduction histidine kinase
MKEMAAHAGGIFEVDSTPGKGTTVRASLPLKTEAFGPGDVTARAGGWQDAEGRV